MHIGILAAECDWPPLAQAVEGSCGELIDEGEISAQEWLELPLGEDVFHIATENGRTYALDPPLVLSSCTGLIVSVSETLSCLVAGLGGDSTSRTFWLAAADRGRPVRVHFEGAAMLTKPFDLGAALPSEATIPWNDVDGKGILARLGDLGFDAGLFQRGPSCAGRRARWPAEKYPQPGELDRRISEHCERYKFTGARDLAVQQRRENGRRGIVRRTH